MVIDSHMDQVIAQRLMLREGILRVHITGAVGSSIRSAGIFQKSNRLKEDSLNLNTIISKCPLGIVNLRQKFT